MMFQLNYFGLFVWQVQTRPVLASFFEMYVNKGDLFWLGIIVNSRFFCLFRLLLLLLKFTSELSIQLNFCFELYFIWYIGCFMIYSKKFWAECDPKGKFIKEVRDQKLLSAALKKFLDTNCMKLDSILRIYWTFLWNWNWLKNNHKMIIHTAVGLVNF